MGYTRSCVRDIKSRRSSINQFLFHIYAYSFLDELVFIYQLYAVMFADHGLSVLQISILFTVWSITGLVLEIPSGTLADKYSRKHLLLIAQIIKTSAFACWMLFPCFWGFLAGFILWGTSGAFCSGTFEALVYDELKQIGHEKRYSRVIGRVGTISIMAVLISSVLAAPMAQFGYRFVTAVSLIPLTLSCVPMLLLQPAKKVESTHETEYFSLLKQGVGEALRNRAICGLMVFICFALILGALDEFWPLMGRYAGLSNSIIPLFAALNCVADAVACSIAHRFEHLSLRCFYAAYLVSGALLLVTTVVMRPAALLLIPVFTFLMKVCGIVFEAKLQHAIEGEARATVLSVKGFFTEVGCIPVFCGIGLVADKYNHQAGFGFFAGLMVVVGVLYLVFGCRRESKGDVETGCNKVETLR